MGKLSKKLVVYLDQNFISDIAKSKTNPGVKEEFSELFELLHKGFLEEKLVVPSSWFHEIETCLIPEFKKRIKETQAYMGQIKLKNKENIYTFQLERATNDFLNIKNKPIDYKMAYHDNPDQILKFYNVSIDMHLEQLHNKQEREDLATKIDANREGIKVNYKTQLEREVSAYSDGFLRYDNWRVVHLFNKNIRKIQYFAVSENFKNIPLVEIGSKLWARILTAHGNRKVQSGDSTDVEVISSYLPYVDVIAIDNFMANNVKELKLDEKHKTAVFSAKGKGLKELIAFISDYLDKNHPVNVPDITIFVLSDDKIKNDSFEFFRKLGSLCSRYYINVYAFDDGNMPEYQHRDSKITMPFNGLQEVHHINIKSNASTEEIITICKEKCRSKKFIIIDSYRDLPNDFIKTLIEYCEKDKNMILSYNIHNK
jgi:hypothetical protein